MSQTVQKQESSNTEQDTESLELGKELDKSWSGLYSRWKGQLEKDFEEDSTQKRKLWLHGSIAGSIPILFLAVSSLPTLLITACLSFLWLGVMKKDSMSLMSKSTITVILYSSGLLFYTVPFAIAIIALVIMKSLKNPFEYLQNSS